MPETQVLVIDDEVEVGTFLRRLLQKKGYAVSVAVSGAEAARLIVEKKFNVAMVDLKLPDADGLCLLQQIKNRQPDCEVIIMTGYSTTRTAVKAIQLGAFDYLEKPFEDIGEVEKIIERASEYRVRGYDGRPVNAEWAPIADRIGFQVGTSQAMQKLVSIAFKIAKKNINVLIQGETGTGKEVLARFIHAASNRADQIFIPVNCGALPENLLESELFGHEKGAFTGAGATRRGIFELANRGTLFLDEVGESSLSIQVKLLRVLETGEFLRVGGEKPIKTDVRIIAATNVDLEQALKEKTFREDLFYRLDVVRLEVPPLRNRREDIPYLTEYFVKRLNPELHVSVEAMRILYNYPWPGNVRELANTISQAVALCDGKIILPEHLSGKLVSGGSEPAAAGNPGGGAPPEGCSQLPPQSLEELLEYYSAESVLEAMEEGKLAGLKGLLRRLDASLSAAMRKKGIEVSPPPSLEKVEAEAVRNALNYYRGNITLAARALGIGRNTLYRKMKDYGIKY
ncbi:response regulator [Pelotomaculum thermopropionicum SI]|uniref:Stage 0 sporulation protein A homolog n=1 Tax=Pelotomaculum thermopropionicum (strain DSM 13744 / JCM 10971 / SI) TaxID=370438 RepID=A5CYX3_PELTS|nr:response regulator [Pelotomaculum thermopropionicum SI]